MLDAIYSSFVAGYGFVSNTVVYSFNLSYFVGQLIVWSLLTICSAIQHTIFTVQTLSQVLYEDCHIFLADVVSKFCFIGEALFACVQLGTEVGRYLSSSLGKGVENLYTLILSFVYSIINVAVLISHSIQTGCVLLKDAIILVGSTSWSVFTFIPHQIIVLKHSVISLLLFFMKGIRHSIFISRVYLYSTYCDVLLFVRDVPQESVYGLCLFILSGCILFKYWQNIYPSSVRYLGCFIYQCHRTLLLAWNYLETFTLWLLTNQRNPAFLGTNNHQDGSGEIELQTRASLDNQPSSGIPDQKQSMQAVQDQEDRLCVVCQDEERSTIILPCRHVCLCYDCCSTIKRTHGRCPICRHVVRRTMRVYI